MTFQEVGGVRVVATDDKRVVATDEKVMTLGGGVRGMWVKKGERPPPRLRTKFGPSIKFWAGSSWEGKTPLYFLPKHMTGPGYLDFIKEKAEPDLLRLYPNKRKKPIWLQDGDGCRTATVVQNYLQKSRISPLDGYPSHSPDLNWQETVWEV